MATAPSRKKGATYNLCCGGYKSYGAGECGNHFIDYDFLYDAVLGEIRKWLSLSEEEKEGLLKELEQAEIQKQKKQGNHMESPSILKMENRKLEIGTLLKNLYEDHAFGRISAFTYNSLVKEYEAELFSLEQSIGAINHPLETDTATSDAYKDFFRLLNEVAECKELTKPLLRNFIDRIEVEQGHYEKDAHGKKVKKQKIKIYYRFIG